MTSQRLRPRWKIFRFYRLSAAATKQCKNFLHPKQNVNFLVRKVFVRYLKSDSMELSWCNQPQTDFKCALVSSGDRWNFVTKVQKFFGNFFPTSSEQKERKAFGKIARKAFSAEPIKSTLKAITNHLDKLTDDELRRNAKMCLKCVECRG